MDAVTLAVLRGRLEQIADEMDATLFRTAFNPIIAEAHDASHGIYEVASGATLVQGRSGLPVFVGSMAGAVALAIDTAGGEFAEGDIWVFNDPYRGGTHLNDMKLVMPWFWEGEPVCHLASVGHYTDVGGAVPGNYNPAATDIYQEGVLIPPVKLCIGGELQEEVVEMICAASRTPINAYGDLHGQLNALELGARRMTELFGDYGLETVMEAFAELTDRSERLMRACIAELPDGEYACDDYLDNDGVKTEQIRVAVDLTIAGDELTLDFARTAAAAAGPVSISETTATAACYVALKHIFRDVPANGGCMAPVEVRIPEGSLLAASWPRPVGGYTETILRVMDVIFGAVAKADPSLSNGASYGTINALSIAGRANADDPGWVMFTFYGGGLGGNPESDGLNHGNAPLSTATIPPVEILEAAYPVRYTKWALRSDSGGAGRHRGGLGAEYEIELLAETADAFAFGDRGRFPPQGVAGGGPGALNRLEFDGVDEAPMVSKITGVRLQRGQRIRLQTPGGGGYGDPAERAEEALARDVELGYVTDPNADSGLA